MVHTDGPQLTFQVDSVVSVATLAYRNMSLVAIKLNYFM